MKIRIIPVLCISLLFPGTFARAQENMPAWNMNKMDRDAAAQSSSISGPHIAFNYPNPYMNDALLLQYQNVMLGKMIQRQNLISRTEKSFMEVGVPFMQPSPPRGICEQLPVNVPCYKAYPDLFPGAVPEVSELEEGMLEDPVDIGLLLDQPQSEVQETIPYVEPQKEPVVALDAYSWAEIMCAGGKCTAVIVKDSLRRTVHEGDLLEENISVSKITKTGVDIMRDGNVYSLGATPAPSRGGLSSPKYAGRSSDDAPRSVPIQDAFRELSAQSQNRAAPVAVMPAPQVVSETIPPNDLPASPLGNSSAEPVTDAGPPLGPTGLF